MEVQQFNKTKHQWPLHYKIQASNQYLIHLIRVGTFKVSYRLCSSHVTTKLLLTSEGANAV